jgi:sarcosine oxidase
MAGGRVVVVGAGALGAASAWALSRRGYDVSVVERFEVGHDRGSSHGHARIFRLAYAQADYVELAYRALAAWSSFGDGVYTRTGSIDHGDEGMLESLLNQPVEFRRLTAEDAMALWPGMRFEGDVLLHAEGGRIDAERAVLAMLGDVPVRAGVQVRDVDSLDADLVVLACGAWTPSVAPSRLRVPPLKVTLEQPFHWQTRSSGLEWPSFIHWLGEDEIVYGLDEPGAGVKVGEHGTGNIIDPDGELRPFDPHAAMRLRTYVEHWLPGIDPDAGIAAPCLYDTTPTHDPVIDRWGDVIVAYGFSGHGFKFAPAVGELVADLADGGKTWPRFAMRGPRAVPDPKR